MSSDVRDLRHRFHVNGRAYVVDICGCDDHSACRAGCSGHGTSWHSRRRVGASLPISRWRGRWSQQGARKLSVLMTSGPRISGMNDVNSTRRQSSRLLSSYSSSWVDAGAFRIDLSTVITIVAGPRKDLPKLHEDQRVTPISP